MYTIHQKFFDFLPPMLPADSADSLNDHFNCGPVCAFRTNKCQHDDLTFLVNFIKLSTPFKFKSCVEGETLV